MLYMLCMQDYDYCGITLVDGPEGSKPQTRTRRGFWNHIKAKRP